MPIQRRVPPPEKYGARVTQLRPKQGISKSDLAKAVGVTVTCVWNWEEGNTHPRAPSLVRLAQALKTTPEYLEYGERDAGDVRVDELRAQDPARSEKSLADVIQQARETIAAVAGLPFSQVRIVLDYGGQP
jgi:transcriptional regulator with XRE-family HTH domain